MVWAYGRFAEERSLKRIAKESARASVRHTQDFLVRHFDQVVPTRTYPRISAPTEEFRRDFASHLESSGSYVHRGADASFAMFRLTSLAHHQCIRDKRLIRICLLDPRVDNVLRQRAKLELDSSGKSYSVADLHDEQTKVRDAIFISLAAAFSIRHTRTVEVFFHRDNPFYRAELFDDAVFISYYLGGEYPGTYLFGKDSYVYKAFSKSIENTCENPDYRLYFDAKLTESEFATHLTTLGYNRSAQELERARETDFVARTAALPFTASEPF